MPRYPRKYLDTSFFHVITQGIEKRYIFDNPQDIKYYIKLMYKLKEEHNIKVIAYCIMNNHAHILLNTDKISDLSKYMQRLNMKYGTYYNKKFNRVGYVFRDRFKAEGIYSEDQLNNCIRYIFNNPVEAGICNRPEEYLYSNYRKTNIESNNIDYLFIDVTEDKNNEVKEYIKKYLKQNSLKLTDLEQDEKRLKKILFVLKEEYNMSLRVISLELKINREKIRKIYNSVKQNRPN